MCQQVIQFCSGSTKPLLIAGGLLTLLLAIAIGFTGCSNYSLYRDIDPAIAETKSTAYYLQLLASGYLVLITLFSCVAAYYDQKHSIRALSVLTSVNFILAVAAILMMSGADDGQQFAARLTSAQKLYNFTDKPQPYQANGTNQSNDQSTINDSLNSTIKHVVRLAMEMPTSGAEGGTLPLVPSGNNNQPESLTAQAATKLWDSLQQRGCCGFKNATEEWTPMIPKSCCSKPISQDGKYKCSSIESYYARPCADLIGSAGMNLIIVLALIALVNLYLATVTGVSTYRTFHYDEASQSAYT